MGVGEDGNTYQGGLRSTQRCGVEHCAGWRAHGGVLGGKMGREGMVKIINN